MSEQGTHRRVRVLADDDSTLVEFRLPRVSHIIDTVLAKPRLPAHYYKTAIEGVSRLGELYGDKLPTDAPSVSQLLADNDLDPWSKLEVASTRGTTVHGYFERLVAAMNSGGTIPLPADALPEGYEGAGFYVAEHRDELKHALSEEHLCSPRQGYAGSADLVFPRVRITDLKTSGGIYFSHHLQVEAYRQAWNEMHPDLSIPEGGTELLWVKPGLNRKGYRVIQGKARPEDWHHVLGVYEALTGRGGVKK